LYIIAPLAADVNSCSFFDLKQMKCLVHIVTMIEISLSVISRIWCRLWAVLVLFFQCKWCTFIARLFRSTFLVKANLKIYVSYHPSCTSSEVTTMVGLQDMQQKEGMFSYFDASSGMHWW